MAWLATKTGKDALRRRVGIEWDTVGRICDRVVADELDSACRLLGMRFGVDGAGQGGRPTAHCRAGGDSETGRSWVVARCGSLGQGPCLSRQRTKAPAPRRSIAGFNRKRQQPAIAMPRSPGFRPQHRGRRLSPDRARCQPGARETAPPHPPRVWPRRSWPSPCRRLRRAHS